MSTGAQLKRLYQSNVYYRSKNAKTDLGMFSMFGRTGAPQRGDPHKPEIVERYAMRYV